MKGLFLEEIFILCYQKDEKRGEEKRNHINLLTKYLKNELEKNLNIYIKDIELIRDSFNFRVTTIDNEKIFFNFTKHNNTCEINFNHNYEIVLKMKKDLIDKALNKSII